MTKPADYLPQHCHHKPTDTGYVRLSGKSHYTGRWGSPEARFEYDRLIREWILNGRKPLNPADKPEGYLVDDLILDFWLHAKDWYKRADGTPTDELRNIRYALKPLRPRFGKMRADEFGPKELKLHREGLIDRGLCRNVVNQQVSIVRRVFNWGVSEEKVPPEVAFALTRVLNLPYGRSRARETKPIRAIALADMEAVVPHVSRQVAAMIQLQELTGMRPGEVVVMRMVDLDLSGKIWIYQPSQHKTKHHGKDRIIPIGPKGQAILKPFFKLNREAFLFDPRDVDAEHRERKARTRKSKVTPSQRARRALAMQEPQRVFNDRYSVITYARAITRGCVKAEIEPWTPNQLRHAAATRLRKEHGIEAARVILGHSSVTTTEIYAEVNREAAMRIMEQSG